MKSERFKAKKCVSIILVVLFSFFIPVTAFASNSSTVSQKAQNSYYERNISETVVIDGKNYIFNYYLDNNNNRTVKILDEQTGRSDIVTYCEKDNIIYHNNEVLMQVNSNGFEATELPISPFSKWTYLTGPDCSYISWAKGTTVAVVAGAFSVYLGGIGGAAVIAAMGTSALSIIASSCSGGTICVTVYYMRLVTSIQYKYVWKFTASTGNYYGPYTYFTNPAPY